MKKLKKIMKYFACSLLFILLIFSLYAFIQTKILKKDYVNIFGYTYFVVATGSMSGTMEVNDIIIVKINDSYQEQDIITYYDEGDFITHRVISIEKEKVITRGDVNNIEDNPVSKENVIGRVVFVLSIALLSKIGIGVVIVLFLIILANFEKIFRKYIIKDTKQQKKEENTPPLEYTQVIKINKDNKIPLLYQPENDIEILEVDEDKEFFNLVLKVLKLKKKKCKLTTANSLKLKYLYELAYTIKINPKGVEKCINEIPFEELYDYKFEDISFTKSIQDKLYIMPIYVFLKIMVYTLLYDENEYFDAVYKVLKYRIRIDRNINFIKDNRGIDSVLSLIEDVIDEMKIEENFDVKHIKEKVVTVKKAQDVKFL